MNSIDLPDGVDIIELTMHRDHRGAFTEAFREQWFPELHVKQWNIVHSEKKVLRGVHFHKKHTDYLILAAGRAVFALADLRKNSPTVGLTTLVEASGEHLRALIIPPGVAHGFYFFTSAIHVYAVTEYWDEDDELGCRFDDPDLGINWPTTAPILSDRDAHLPALHKVAHLVPEYQIPTEECAP